MVSEKQKKIDEARAAKESLMAKPPLPVAGKVIQLTAPAGKAGRKPRAEVSVKKMIADLFREELEKERSTTEVVETVLFRNPDVKDTSVRFMITQLKQEGFLRETRRDGRVSILRAVEPGSVFTAPLTKPDGTDPLIIALQAERARCVERIKSIDAFVASLK